MVWASWATYTTVLPAMAVRMLAQTPALRILVGGRDAADYSLASFRRALGYVTQESVMYAGTIRSNLLHGLDRTPSEEELDSARP